VMEMDHLDTVGLVLSAFFSYINAYCAMPIILLQKLKFITEQFLSYARAFIKGRLCNRLTPELWTATVWTTVTLKKVV